MQGSPANIHDVLARLRHVGRIGAMTIAVVLLVLAGVLVYVFGNSSTQSSRVALEHALAATDAAVTADVALEVKVGYVGITAQATATGAADFASKALSLRIGVLGHTFAFVESHGAAYVELGKLLDSQFPGRTWVRVPFSALGGAHGIPLPETSDPRRLLPDLLKLGATITPAGTGSIDGARDQAYRLHLTLADLKAHASELPRSIRSLFTASGSIPTSARESTTMYVDPAGQLQAVHVVISARIEGHRATASVDLTMSHFGTATIRAAPPPSQTVTYRRITGTLFGSHVLTLGLRGAEAE